MLFEEATGGVNLLPESSGLRMVEKWVPEEGKGTGTTQRENGRCCATQGGVEGPGEKGKNRSPEGLGWVDEKTHLVKE